MTIAMTSCQHADEWFDRTLCFCGGDDGWPGIMHSYCSDCGEILSDKARHEAAVAAQPKALMWDTPEDRERLIATIHELHARGTIRLRKHGNPEHVGNVADAIIAELRAHP